MSKQDQVSASPKAVKDAENMWVNFLKASKICGVAIGITLILMALLLV
jgi:hypothetical protein